MDNRLNRRLRGNNNTIAKGITKMITGIVVSVILLLSCGHDAWCSDLHPKQFIHDLNAILEEPIPNLSSVLPGYSRPKQASPSLVVAELTSDQEAKMPWGSAIGRILRRKIMSCPKIYLRMPDPKVLRRDAWAPGMSDQDVLRSIDSLRLVGRRLGIDTALTGSIKINANQYKLDLQLIKLPSAKIRESFHYSGNITDMPVTLSKVALQVYATLGVKLDKNSQEYLSQRTPKTSEEIVKFVQLLAKLKNKMGEQALESVKPFIDRRVSLAAAVPLYLYYLEPGRDLRAYLKRLDEVTSVFPSDAGIKLLVASYGGYKASGSLLQVIINRLRTIVRENPQDPTAMIILSELLTADRRYLDAIAVCEEALDRWPDQYRIWWSTAYILNEYAGHVRGRNFWVDVPSKGKRLFLPLKDLAYSAVNRAIRSNPYESDLWVQKIWAIANYSDEMMESFYRAIELSPHNKRAYAAALNFTLPQWGGSVEAQEEVWNTAVNNNPDQPWLEEIRKEYMKKPPAGD